MSGFSIQRKESNKIAILYLKGYLDAHTAPDFETALQDCIDDKMYDIVVNLAELTYISSAGLGVFMGFIEDIRNDGGDIKLAEMTDKVFRVFDLLGFPLLYEIFTKESEAIDRFSGDANRDKKE